MVTVAAKRQGSQARTLARAMKAIAHPERIEILRMLIEHPGINVSELRALLTSSCGRKVSASMVSHSLRALYDAELLELKEKASANYYTVRLCAISELLSTLCNYTGITQETTGNPEP